MVMPVDLQLKDHVLYLSGYIDFDNAKQVYQQGIPFIKQHIGNAAITLDLSGLTSSNTISLAVFVQWLRLSLPQCGVHLIKVPAKMMAIIQASSLQADFGL